MNRLERGALEATANYRYYDFWSVMYEEINTFVIS